jgi:TatD DNase family protein
MLIDIHSHDIKTEPNVFRMHSTSDWKSVLNTDFTLHPGQGLSVGVHPWEALSWNETEKEALRGVLNLPDVMMVGEIGLDKVCHVPVDLQQLVFQFQVDVAAACKKPVVLHGVKAMAELLAIRKRVAEIPAWIIHGFRGGPEAAAQYISAGFYLSFGKNHNKASLQLCPADRLFLETDENGDLYALYEAAARERGVSVEVLETTIERTFRALFPTTLPADRK